MNNNLFNKNFTLVVIGQIISLFGTAILRFALPLYLLLETGSASLFGGVMALQFIPYIILTLIGGVIADRFNKKNIMVILDFTMALILMAIILLIETVDIVPLFMTSLILISCIGGLYQPTVQACIPLLSSKENMMKSGAIISQVNALDDFIGPIIAGVLLTAFGIKPILVISMICFTLSSLMEMFIKIPHAKKEKKESVYASVKNDLKESVEYVCNSNQNINKIGFIILLFNLIISSLIIVGVPLLITEVLGLSLQMLGYSSSAIALGALIGGILTGVFSDKLKIEKCHLILLASSLMIVVMAVPLLLNLPTMLTYFIIVLSSMFIMIIATMFTIQIITYLQIKTPEHLVGKVIALMMTFAMLGQPIGLVLYGFLFEIMANDVALLILLAAIGSVIISLKSRTFFKAFKE